ncbi:MAG: flagellar basal body rod protein FlgC [Deltaproteobacteria bacterium]|nr:flagellar basal body rod protein FlgC [Deltaproteobacteria bacterium]
MSLLPSLAVTASGLKAQKMQMDITSANLANAQTTRGPDGKPYQRISPVFEAVPLNFETALKDQIDVQLSEVKLAEIYKDPTPFQRVYDPGHPDADKKGFVELPNVNLVQEMTDMLMASRAYEANVTAFNTTKTMALKILDMAKV